MQAATDLIHAVNVAEAALKNGKDEEIKAKSKEALCLHMYIYVYIYLYMYVCMYVCMCVSHLF